MRSSASRAKRDRERLREEKAARKRARRREGATSPDNPDERGPRRAQSDVLSDLTAVHRGFEDGVIGFDEFAAKRDELIGHLDVD